METLADTSGYHPSVKIVGSKQIPGSMTHDLYPMIVHIPLLLATISTAQFLGLYY